MGISEPVLEEEGSLIAGWRAKFGEENHQVFVFIVVVVVAVVVDTPVVVDTVVVVNTAVVVAVTDYNNKINPYYRRTVLCLTLLLEQAGLVASSMVSIGGHLTSLCFRSNLLNSFICVLFTLLNLSSYALDARLAIAITANFVNNWWGLLQPRL